MKPSAMFQRLWNWNVAATLTLIVLAWPGLWAIWMLPGRITPRPAPLAAPLISYSLSDPIDSQELWSPLLFSLPTPYGFSRTVQMEWLETRGIPVVPPPRTPQLEFRPESFPLPASELSAARVTSAILNSVPAYHALPEISGITRPDPVTGHDNVLLFSPSLNLKAIEFLLPENWRTQIPAHRRPWRVAASIEVASGGQVRYVMLTAPHESSEINNAILAVLRRGRAVETGQPTRGDVIIALP